MAKSAHVRANFPYPESAYHAAVAAGIEAARAWFDTPVKSAGEHKDAACIKYAGRIIDTHEPGRIPLGAATQGFRAGFDRGLALIGLVWAVSWEMERRACDIQDWARDRIKEGA